MRREVSNRPLLLTAACFAVGLASVADPWRLLLAPVLLAFSASWPIVGILAAALIAGFAMGPQETPPLLDTPKMVQGAARIESVPDRLGDRQRMVVSANSARYVAYAPGHWNLRFGMVLGLEVLARPPALGTERWMKAWRTQGILSLEKMPLVLDEGPTTSKWASEVRQRFLAFSQASLPAKLRDLLNGLCINADQELDPPLRRALQRTGTIHIVSASGYHVFVLSAFLIGGLRLLRLPRAAEIGALALALGFFCLVAGLEPPIVRASFMAVTLQAAFLFRREADAMSALALAAGVYLVCFPTAIYDLGFQLSAVAVGGLAIGYRRVEMTGRSAAGQVLAVLQETLRTALVATVAISPLLAYHFGRFSLISVVANPLVAPAVSFAMVAAFGLFLLSGALPLVAAALASVLVRPFLGWLWQAAEWLSALPFAEVETPAFDAWLLAPIYACLIALWRWKPVAA